MPTWLRCHGSVVGLIHYFYDLFQTAFCRLHYLYNGIAVSVSCLYTRTHLGPSNVPCGTPPLACQSDMQLFPIWTCWIIFKWKVAIHFRLHWGVSRRVVSVAISQMHRRPYLPTIYTMHLRDRNAYDASRYPPMVVSHSVLNLRVNYYG